MIKSELIDVLAEQNPHLYQRDLDTVVTAVLDTIAQALKNGQRVELRGFGSFAARKRLSRSGRNPRTGEQVSVPNKVAAHFKPGKEMLEQINGGKVPGRNRKR